MTATTSTKETKATETKATMTVWERLGALEGLWAAILLGLQLGLASGMASPSSSDASYASSVLANRPALEWVTLLRVVGGLMLIWFLGSLVEPLRAAEGHPSRLSTIVLVLGTVWGVVWLFSALFNSASILFAADYANPAGSRFAGTLARESLYVLSPGILVALLLASSFATLRFGGLPRWHGLATLALCALLFGLAIVDWWGPGNLSFTMLVLGLGWTAVTSAYLVVRGMRPLVAAARMDVA